MSYRSQFESLVTELGCQFIRRDIYVPSFHEMYPFNHSLCDGKESSTNVVVIVYISWWRGGAVGLSR